MPRIVHDKDHDSNCGAALDSENAALYMFYMKQRRLGCTRFITVKITSVLRMTARLSVTGLALKVKKRTKIRNRYNQRHN